MKYVLLIICLGLTTAHADCVIRDTRGKPVVYVVKDGSEMTAYSPKGRFLCAAHVHSDTTLDRVLLGKQRLTDDSKSGELYLKKEIVTFVDGSSPIRLEGNQIIADALDMAIATFSDGESSECTTFEALVGGAGFVLQTSSQMYQDRGIGSGPID